jgi:hypothetical protein
MKKNWASLTAGILDVISGAGGLIGSLILFTIGIIGSGLIKISTPDVNSFLAGIPFALFIIIALLLFIMGILAIIGGIFAIQGKNWGWALTGAIVAFLLSWILGIPSIVFTILARNNPDR